MALCVVAGWYGSSQPAGQDQESRQYTNRTTSRLVLLDVSVKDAEGGLAPGTNSEGTDADCDCPEAVTAARELLRETGLIFGRQSKPFSHYIYRTDPPVRTQQFHDPMDHATLIELRGLSSDGSIGLQTVVSPSVHETGEAVRFEQGFDGTLVNVDADVLVSAVRRVAAAALLSRHWPTKGSPVA